MLAVRRLTLAVKRIGSDAVINLTLHSRPKKMVLEMLESLVSAKMTTTRIRMDLTDQNEMFIYLRNTQLRYLISSTIPYGIVQEWFY